MCLNNLNFSIILIPMLEYARLPILEYASIKRYWLVYLRCVEAFPFWWSIAAFVTVLYHANIKSRHELSKEKHVLTLSVIPNFRTAI